MGRCLHGEGDSVGGDQWRIRRSGDERRRKAYLAVHVEGVVGEGRENGNTLQPALIERRNVLHGVLRGCGCCRCFDEVHGQSESAK